MRTKKVITYIIKIITVIPIIYECVHRIIRSRHNNSNNISDIKTVNSCWSDLCKVLSKYKKTQVFFSRSTVDTDDQFITVYNKYEVLIRYNTHYDYLEILTPRQDLWEMILQHFIDLDPDLPGNYLVTEDI